jgi:hypothetical protein
MRAENKGLSGKYLNSLDLSARFWYGLMILVLLLSDTLTMIDKNTRYIFFFSHLMVWPFCSIIFQDITFDIML